MRLSIKAGQLKRAIQAIWPSVGTHVESEIRYFNPILIRAEKGGVLKLHAVYHSRFSWAEINAEVEEEGATSIPSGVLRDIASTLDESAVVEMELDERLTIREGKSVWQIYTFPAEDFKTVEVEGACTFKFDLPLFRDMLRQATPVTASMSGDRFIYDAIEIKREVYEDEKLDVVRVASCDGHRIHIIEADIIKEIGVDPGDFDILDEKGILVDRSISKVVATLPDEELVEVSFGPDKANIILKAGGVTHGIQLIKGMFAPYEKIVDKIETISTVRVNRKDLSRAVRGARVLGENTSLVLAVEAGELIPLKISAIKSAGRDKKPETSYSEIEGTYEGDFFKLALNPRYISDSLGAITDAEEIELIYSGENSPLVIKHPERYFRSFVMPVQLPGGA